MSKPDNIELVEIYLELMKHINAIKSNPMFEKQ